MTEEETMVSEITQADHGSPLATASGFGAVLLWSTTVAFARSLSEQVGSVTAATGVYSVSAVVALAVLLRSRERRRKVLRLPAKYLVGCGALFVSYMVLIFLAVGRADSRSQVLEVGLINYLWPILTLVLSVVFLGRKPHWGLAPGTLLALAGLFLVVTHGAEISWESFVRNLASNPAAYLLAVAAAVCWGVYSNLTRRWIGGQGQGAVTVFMPLTAVVLLLVCGFVDEPRGWTGHGVVEAVFLGVASFAANSLWESGMRRGNMVLVAAFSYLTPLFSTIVSCLYLAVVPGAKLWVGCGVLILGSIVSWRSVTNSRRV